MIVLCVTNCKVKTKLVTQVDTCFLIDVTEIKKQTIGSNSNLRVKKYHTNNKCYLSEKEK